MIFTGDSWRCRVPAQRNDKPGSCLSPPSWTVWFSQLLRPGACQHHSGWYQSNLSHISPAQTINKLKWTFRPNVLWICDVGAFLYIYFKLFVLWKLTLFDWYKPLTFCQFLLLLHFCWSASNWWVVRGAILCVVPVMSQQEMVLWRIKGEWRGRTGLALDNLYHSRGRG